MLQPITDSVENVRSVAYVNGKESVSLLVYCSPGANVISTVDEIKRELPSIRASIPSNEQLLVTGDLTTTIRASVKDVERTLVLSIGLVVLVVFLFLRNATGHPHPRRGGDGLSDRHICGDVSVRLHAGQSIAHGPCHLHRVCRR